MVFLVCKRLRRTNDYRVAGVNADGVKVFHIADGNRRVVFVPDYFVFDFLVALYAFFDEHLLYGRNFKRVFHESVEFLGIFGKSAARTAERKRRPQYHGITYSFGDLSSLLDGRRRLRRQNGLAERLAEFFEFFPVLRFFDRSALCAEKLDAAFL